MRPMPDSEQTQHREATLAIRSALSALRLLPPWIHDEDTRVAAARLENWLSENDERWVK